MNNFAISSNGIAEGLKRSAAVLVESGSDLEQSIAMMAAGNKVIQDPEQVGNALKTLSMRIRGTKTELEAAGESTEGMAINTSKLRDQVKALTDINGSGGVDILDANGEYRDIYNILVDIAEVYDDILNADNKRAAALTELLAGKNRANVLAAILQNPEDLKEAYEMAQESEGSALAENERYLDSIQGRIDQFTNSLQTMWANTLSSDMVKFVVDLGTEIINLVNALGMLPTALGLLSGVMVARDSIHTDFENIKNGMNDVSEATVAYTEAAEGAANADNTKAAASQKAAAADEIEAQSSTQAATADATEATASNQAATADQAEAIASTESATADTAEAVASNQAATADTVESASSTGAGMGSLFGNLFGSGKGKGAGASGIGSIFAGLFGSGAGKGASGLGKIFSKLTSLKPVSKIVTSLSGSLSKLGGTLKIFGKGGLKGLAIGALITVATSGITKLVGKMGDLHQSQEEIEESAQNVINTYSTAKTTLADTKSTISGFKDEFEKLSVGVDSFGNNVSLSADEYARYNEIANQIAGMFPQMVSGYTAEGNAILSCKGDVDALTKAYEEQEKAARQAIIAGGDDVFKTFKTNYDEKLAGQQDVLKKMLEAYSNKDYDAIAELIKSSDNISDLWKDADIDSGAFWGKLSGLDSAEFDKIAPKLQSYMQTLQSQINAEAANVTPLIEAYVGEDADYQALEDKHKSLINNLVSSLDADILNKYETAEDVYTWVHDNFIKPFSDPAISQEFSTAIDSVFDVQSKFNKGDISLGRYLDELSEFTNYIDGLNIDSEAKNQIKLSLNADELTEEYDILMNRLTETNKDNIASGSILGLSPDAAREFIDGLSSEELKVAMDVIADPSFTIKDITKEDIKSELKELGQGGTVDLTMRPVIDSSLLKNAGWEDAGEGAATVFTSTFSNKAGDIAMNFTPIIADENGKHIGTLSPEELTRYAEGVIDGTRKDDLNLQIGAKFEGEEAISEAEKAAQRIHNLHDAYYLDGDTSDLALQSALETAMDVKMIMQGMFDIDITDVKSGIETVNTALTESRSAIGLTTESITALENRYNSLDGYNAAALFEKTANGIHLNNEELRKLEAQYANTTKLNLDSSLNTLANKYEEVTEQIENCTDAKQREELQNQAQTYSNKIEELATLAAQYDGLTSAYNEWQTAQSGTEEGANYDSIYEGLEGIQELYKKGLVGTDKFRASVQLMSSEDLSTAGIDELVSAYQSGISKIKRYFTEGSTGCQNFLKDVSELNSEWAHMNKDGTWEIDFGVGGDQDVAEALGINVDTVQQILRKLKDYGFEIEIDSEYTSLSGLQEKIKQTEKNLKELDEEPVDIDVDVEKIETIESEIDSAKSKIKEINNSSADVDVKTAKLDDAQVKLEALIDKKIEASQPTFMNLNTSQVSASLTGALQKVQEYQSSLNELNKLSELKESGITIDDSQITLAKQKVDECAKSIQELDGNVKVSIGLEQDGSIESIKKSFEDGKVSIGTDTTVATNNIEQLAQNVEKIEDKDVTISAKVDGLDDVKDLNKNIDLATNVSGNVDKLSAFVKGAKALEDVDDNIESKVTANVYGNVTGRFEEQLDNLKVFSDSAKDLYRIGEVEAKATANVYGNVTGRFEEQLDNLKVFTDNAKDLHDIGTVEAKATANVYGNVTGRFEEQLDNLKVFSDNAKDLDGVGEVEAKVTANVYGNVTGRFEEQLDNLKVFSDSAQDLEDVGEIESKVTANVYGNVTGRFEEQLDNLKVFTDSAQGLESIGEIESKVTASVYGNVTGRFEEQLDNLKVFTDSAKGVKNIGEDVKASVTADVHGSVFTNPEGTINNLDTFVDSAEGIKDLEGETVASVTADVSGSVFTNPEWMINNLKTFTDSAKDIHNIGENAKAKVTAEVDGNVVNSEFEYQLDNLKVFTDSAKGIRSVGEDTKAKVTANVEGNVVDGMFEMDINNLKTFVDSAQGIKDIDGETTAKVTADIDGNVFTNTEGIINNLGVFVDSAKGIKDLEGETKASVTASIDKTITNDAATTLSSFENALSKLSVIPAIAIKVTASIPVETINKAITVLTKVSENSSLFKNYNANVKVNASVNSTAVDNYQPAEKNGTAKYQVDSTAVDNWTPPTKTGDVDYNANVEALTYAQKHKTGTITYKAKVTGPGKVDGTAHSKGTAWAGGTAFKGGSWGAPKTETALVGELGPELLVRNGRWTTIGENGAEFAGIKRGDIIFNHKQTEELLKNGYVTSGGGRGKAFAEGTAYSRGGGAFWVPSSSGSGVKQTGTAKTSTTKSSTKKSTKDTQDAFEELFDWFEVRIEELQEDLDLLAAKLENAVSLSGKNNIIDSMIKKNKQELSALDRGYQLYSGFANKLLKKIPKAYRAEAKDGKIAIEEFYGKVDEKTLEAIKNYREWAQKAADLKVQIQEVRGEITELSKQKLDNIIELFDHVEGLQDARQSHYVDMAEYRDDKGWINSDKYYKQAIREEKNKRASNIKERNKLQAELDKAVEEGRIKVGSKEWYEAVEAIHAVDAAIDENNANIEDYQNKINEINFDNFEKKLYRVSRLAEETQNLIDVLANNPSVDVDDEGNVSFTDEGIAQIGLYAQQMENARKQSEMYAQQIDKLNAMYARGEISYDEYLQKLDEYKDGQYEAIQAEQDAKDAIVELEKARVDEIKNGIDKQIEAYSELIDKKKEELSAEKDLYDFQRQTMDQAKNIADIQRQLAAISGDNSASANAQRKKLEAELDQAKQEQADSFYDRSVSNAQEALDNELEIFTELREREKENWDKWLENTDAVFAHAMETVTNSGTTIKDTIKDVAEEWDLQINNNIIEPWNNAATALQNTEKRLDGIIKKFDDAAAAADRHATTQIRDQKEQNDDIADDRQDPVKGLKVTAKAGTAIYDKNGNVVKTLGKNTTYTAGKTDPKTGRTQVLDNKGNVVGWVNSSSLDVDKNNQFKKGQEINAQNAPIYSSKTDSSGEYQGMTRYIVQSVDKKTGRVKAKSVNKNSKGKYVTGWFKMADVVITKQAPKTNTTTTNTNTTTTTTTTSGTKYYKKYTGKSGSIVDALKAIGVNSSFDNRKKIAKANGISNYSGTGTQNTKLLNLLKKGKLKKYAVGSKNILNDQFALLHELGEELVLHAGANGKLEYLTKGSGVVPADLTSNLMEWGKLDPQSMLDQNRPSVGISPEVHATEINLNIQYGDMLKIENFKGDNPEDIAKIVAKQFEKHTKDLNSALRKYVR